MQDSRIPWLLREISWPGVPLLHKHILPKPLNLILTDRDQRLSSLSTLGSAVAMASLDVPIRPRPTGGQKTTKAVILVSSLFQIFTVAIADDLSRSEVPLEARDSARFPLTSRNPSSKSPATP